MTDGPAPFPPHAPADAEPPACPHRTTDPSPRPAWLAGSSDGAHRAGWYFVWRGRCRRCRCPMLRTVDCPPNAPVVDSGWHPVAEAPPRRVASARKVA